MSEPKPMVVIRKSDASLWICYHHKDWLESWWLFTNAKSSEVIRWPFTQKMNEWDFVGMLDPLDEMNPKNTGITYDRRN